VIAIGLLPLSLWLFAQFSIISFVANSIAIPWIAIAVLPLCFLGILLLWVNPLLAKYVLLTADKNLGMLWYVLDHLSKLPWATWTQSIPHYGFVITSTIGIAILLLPKGFPGKLLGLFWLLPVLLFHPRIPGYGEAKFTLLDVGQGLSAVIQTRGHSLVFDTGAKFSAEHDMGENVVLPFLQHEKINKIDMLVISHADNDHSGGSFAILKKLPVNEIRTSVPYLYPGKASLCLAGLSWEWDGVTFTFFNPEFSQLNQGNNSSCVLMVRTQYGKILVPGDIEKEAEINLIEKYGHLLEADFLVAPHHGSKTSSQNEFVKMVSPKYVLYSTGYLNRYHFPHQQVIDAYHTIRAVQYDTAALGAVTIYLNRKMEGHLEYYARRSYYQE
ncbi:MAG TPA: DNA internalization-related competence protein ComEC/Rec2, partial [Gammaproteobacteria bacterium]|nr:DNA internalization-related competence protein ComEC/Rec2 [Gammaproteobacteria bacterium]